jgi:hypothetical protein
LSCQFFFCLPRFLPPSTVPCMMVMERVSWRVTWPNHARSCQFASLDGR